MRNWPSGRRKSGEVKSESPYRRGAVCDSLVREDLEKCRCRKGRPGGPAKV